MSLRKVTDPDGRVTAITFHDERPRKTKMRYPTVSAFAAGLGLVAVYGLLRSVHLDAVVPAWVVIVVIATIASLTCGVTVLAAIGPFTEALTADGQMTAVPWLLAATGLSLTLRVLATREVPRISIPVASALVILIGSALGVLHAWLSLSAEAGVAAAQLWVPGIGGAMTMLLSGIWLGRTKDLRPMYVAAGSAGLATLVALTDFLAHGALRGSALDWLVRGPLNFYRLATIIPAPNAAAAIFLVAVVVALALALSERRRPVALGATAFLGVGLLALTLTLSRSALVALAAVVAVVAWWRWRLAGLAGAAVAAVAGTAVAVGMGVIRDVPVVADADRIGATLAALRMWLAAPLLGHGFRSFEFLHDAFGSPVLDAPHNEFVRLFAEEGIVVGAAGVVLFVSAVILLLRHRTTEALAGVGVAVALAVMASFNNPFTYAQVNIPSFVTIGIALGASMANMSPHRHGRGTDREGNPPGAVTVTPPRD